MLKIVPSHDRLRFPTDRDILEEGKVEACVGRTPEKGTEAKSARDARTKSSREVNMRTMNSAADMAKK